MDIHIPFAGVWPSIVGEFVVCRVIGGLRRVARLPGDGSGGAIPVESIDMDGAW